jgi:hypothetical protein
MNQLNKFFCPTCKNELEINDLETEILQVNTALSTISKFYKQCHECGQSLYFDAQSNVFKRLTWFKRISTLYNFKIKTRSKK